MPEAAVEVEEAEVKLSQVECHVIQIINDFIKDFVNKVVFAVKVVDEIIVSYSMVVKLTAC